jgi:hypothetical protein
VNHQWRELVAALAVTRFRHCFRRVVDLLRDTLVVVFEAMTEQHEIRAAGASLRSISFPVVRRLRQFEQIMGLLRSGALESSARILLPADRFHQ